MSEIITFKNSKGQLLVGEFFSENPNDPVAIFVHGYRSTRTGSKATKLSETLPKKGISLFAVDLSGRGESEGEFEYSTITQYIDDVKSAIDEISKRTDKIAIIGSSLGGIVSLQEAAKDKRVDVLILLSPVSGFPPKNKGEFSEENIKKWKEQGWIFTESKRFGKMRINYSFVEDGLKYTDMSVYKNIKIPTLIIHGTADESVAIEGSEKLIKHIPNSKLITLEGANHAYSNPEDFNKMIEETINFIIKNLK
jgi:alpha-beta hydrolase superfamily lysophospholipase